MTSQSAWHQLESTRVLSRGGCCAPRHGLGGFSLDDLAVRVAGLRVVVARERVNRRVNLRVKGKLLEAAVRDAGVERMVVRAYRRKCGPVPARLVDSGAHRLESA